MTMTGETYMRDDPQILLRRFSEYVRPFPARVLARMLNCTERTAENFRRAVSWPSARHWRLIVRAFGRDVLAAVFDPEIDHVLARLTMEERQLEDRLNEIRTRRRQAAGLVDSPAERREAGAGEPLDPNNLDLFGGGQ